MSDNSIIHVLIVEDEASVRHSLAGFLEDFDFQISMAESSEEAIEMLKEKSFHVAIVDIRLPGMNGDAFIIKAHELLPSMRFIIYTGSTEYQLSNVLRSVGIEKAHIFLKPQRDLSVFMSTIKDLLSVSGDIHGK